MPDYQSPSGARCAKHEGRPANSICDRCGNFMCDECGQYRAVSSCPSCQALSGGAGFPFSRAAYSFSGIWDYSFEAFKREWLMLSVATLIIIGASMVTGAVTNGMQTAVANAGVGVTVTVRLTMFVVSTMIQGLLQLGFLRMVLDVLQGGRAELGRLGSQVPKAGRYALQQVLLWVLFGVPLIAYGALLASISDALPMVRATDWSSPEDIQALFSNSRLVSVMAIGLLVASVPLIYFTLPLTFVTMELVHDDEVGGWDAIRRAYSIAGGHRLPILGFGFAFSGVLLLGLLACCVGVLPALGMGQLLMAGLYLALRNGSGLKAPAARST